jgi:hypothetical protein
MRFKDYLNEMTVRTGDLTKGIEPSRVKYEPEIIKDGKYIGDLKNLNNQYKIYQARLDSGIQFGLYDEEILVTLFDGRFKKFANLPKCYYLERMITKKEYAGQHLSAKLLLFLKTREKIPVIFSDIHSKDTVHNIRKIARTIPHLSVSWFNVATGMKDEFDPDTDDKDTKHIYGMNGPTKWRIMIEQNKFDLLDDNGQKRNHHFLSEHSRWDVVKDYNIWDMAYCSELLASAVYQEGL